jgi:hypothetical protein
MSETQLAVAGEWSIMKEQASMLVKSGFCPPALNTAEKVIAVMLTAYELKIGKMEAIRSINIIEGKPAMAAQLMLALCQRTKEVEHLGIDEDDNGAHVTIQRKGQKAYTAHFGPTQAKALKLDSKDNYRKQAATMYKWRAIAEACRFVFPDAVCGLYTPEELGADVVVTADGDMEVKPEVARGPLPTAPLALAEPSEEPIEDNTDNGIEFGDAPQSEVDKINKVFNGKTKSSEGNGEEKTISEKQRKLLFVRTKSAGIPENIVKAFMGDNFGKQHTASLTNDELQAMLEWVDRYEAVK